MSRSKRDPSAANKECRPAKSCHFDTVRRDFNLYKWKHDVADVLTSGVIYLSIIAWLRIAQAALDYGVCKGNGKSSQASHVMQPATARGRLPTWSSPHESMGW
jgi:hypothetical protein